MLTDGAIPFLEFHTGILNEEKTKRQQKIDMTIYTILAKTAHVKRTLQSRSERRQ